MCAQGKGHGHIVTGVRAPFYALSGSEKRKCLKGNGFEHSVVPPLSHQILEREMQGFEFVHGLLVD